MNPHSNARQSSAEPQGQMLQKRGRTQTPASGPPFLKLLPVPKPKKKKIELDFESHWMYSLEL